MPLFEVAIIEKRDEDISIHFTAEEGKANSIVKKAKKERLLLAPTAVLAENADAATAKVLLDAKEKLGEYDEDLIEVLCRPFDE